MKHLCLLLSAILLAGCAGTAKKGVSRYDDFDAVKVDQMVGNAISKGMFEKTIVCLNARRETRQVTAITNVIVASVTNQIVNAITNQTISSSTNFFVTTVTSPTAAVAAPQAQAAPGTEGGETVNPALADAATLPPLTNSPATISTNLTVSLSSNQSGSAGPNQATANNQVVRTFNNQITTTSNNLSVTLATNLVVGAETNEVINYVTNTYFTTVTNTIIVPTNYLAADHFLYTEMTPPPDFSLQSGESLVLLVDGVRYGFSQSAPAAAFVGRKGFVTGMYRVPPQLLVAIANAQEVRLRFKGVNSVIERDMNQASRENFKKFLLQYFVTQPDAHGASARTEPSAQDRADAVAPFASAR